MEYLACAKQEILANVCDSSSEEIYCKSM